MTTQRHSTHDLDVTTTGGAPPPGGPTTLDEIRAVELAHVVQTYRRAPVAFVRGEGVWLYDTEGRRYLDLLSGIGVASLGHAHPGLARALASQAATLIHTSNLYFHPLQGQVASRLALLSGLSRAFICNSGTEAVEACLKFARRYWHGQGGPQRTGFVALQHAFSGRTLGALSVTWDEHYRAPFAPLLPGVTFVPADDPAALEAVVDDTTAAIIVEPVQGEGGVRPLPAACARAIEDARTRTGALVIADEVQSGLGRTGSAFAFEAFGPASPDLVAVGKALGGGMPVAAALLSERVAHAVQFGDHGTTYGGNLLACRAALVFLDALTGGLLDHVREVGEHFGRALESLASRHRVVREVRGAGLMWGVDLSVDAAPVVQAALARGLIVNRTRETVIRMLPPFVITREELDEGVERLDASLSDAHGGAA